MPLPEIFKPHDEPAATATDNALETAGSSLPSLMAQDNTQSLSPGSRIRPVAQVLDLTAADAVADLQGDALASPTRTAFVQLFGKLRSKVVSMWRKLEELLGTPPSADDRY